ncbi:WxL domain-containing protein [Enterococcus faecalis]|uniref:WxL domain-containing protein n=1 Tax=Enterococcus faecalis TaxID=1351 RepID=UPI001CF55F85|nr:WxL domain-containing protein [Enterococcus faecalis]EJA1041665.1 WxL domain-containing protein [Enterococcus faecalis]MCA6711371.1 WxL domain-containing protein [Enterococcus faecalis]MCA6724970.1 WxL domain-containing protein [Enterococcus faecalis]MCA6730303.1 WxL domain-containing protein [Enterococcus faecalis]MCA6751261.1 WxL domain-containing protein [Enterococcus faecalis]
MKKKMMASLLVGSAVVGASLAPLSAQATTTGNTPVQVEFGGGLLPDQDNVGSTTAPEPGTPNTDFDLLAIPRVISFASSKIGEDVSAIKQGGIGRNFVHIGDVRGTKEGWHLTAEIPQMINGTDKLDGELNFTMPSYYSEFTVGTDGKGVYVVSSVANGQDDPSTPDFIGTNIKLGSGAVTLVNAATGKGQGLWATELENLTLNVTTPYQQIKAGAYTGGITWNLVTGPAI